MPLPQVKIEARMEILDRNALEAIGVQWGGAGAGHRQPATVVGQGFQSASGNTLNSGGIAAAAYGDAAQPEPRTSGPAGVG